MEQIKTIKNKSLYEEIERAMLNRVEEIEVVENGKKVKVLVPKMDPDKVEGSLL